MKCNAKVFTIVDKLKAVLHAQVYSTKSASKVYGASITTIKRWREDVLPTI